LFDDSKKDVLAKVKELKVKLKKFMPLDDLREDVSPGRKFNVWELKGIPLRIELGPKDLEKGVVVVAKRNTGEKVEVKFEDLKRRISELLDEIQGEMYDAAKELLEGSMKSSDDKKEMVSLVKDKNMVSVPMCEEGKCEEGLKEIMPGLKSLFINSDKSTKDKVCVVCGKDAEYRVYVGRTY
jgi:prolyl-tRNA synthetase